MQPVTLNSGMPMPSWYDIVSLAHDRAEEECAGLDASRNAILTLVRAEEAAGIPLSRIVLAGFSQGAALSCFTGMHMEQQPAGVLMMSGYVPRSHSFAPTDAGKGTPVLMCHGDRDMVVKFAWAEMSRDLMREKGVKDVQFKRYRGMEHSATEQELDDVQDWLLARLPPVRKDGGGAGAEAKAEL